MKTAIRFFFEQVGVWPSKVFDVDPSVDPVLLSFVEERFIALELPVWALGVTKFGKYWMETTLVAREEDDGTIGFRDVRLRLFSLFREGVLLERTLDPEGSGIALVELEIPPVVLSGVHGVSSGRHQAG